MSNQEILTRPFQAFSEWKLPRVMTKQLIQFNRFVINQSISAPFYNDRFTPVLSSKKGPHICFMKGPFVEKVGCMTVQIEAIQCTPIMKAAAFFFTQVQWIAVDKLFVLFKM